MKVEFPEGRVEGGLKFLYEFPIAILEAFGPAFDNFFFPDILLC